MSSPDALALSDDEKLQSESSGSTAEAGTMESAPNAAEEPEKAEVDANAAEDDLPEYEPLTPEHVEEDAIRGDFMLRWAAVLLAMLMGWTVMDRTQVLVDVKTGQYLASHGVLPPRTDVFSATATDRAWVNLSWLWDLLVGGIESAVGFSGLSVLAALIAFATFWIVVQTRVPGLPTWWGSICAVLAAVACFPSLTAIPNIVTLLGAALMMRLLYRWQWDSSKSLWPLVGLFVLWGNLDGRAWIGGAILILFTVGTWVDGFRTLPEGEPRPSGKVIGLVTLCSLAALLVHPFLWETWLAPLRLYGAEYPMLRLYVSSDLPYAFERYSAASPEFWENFGQYSAAAYLTLLIAYVTLLLNRKQLRVSIVLVLLGINLIGIAGGQELAVASIVNAIVATINGQQWYRTAFRQTYSTDRAEILYSSGGRALTVIAIFGLALAVVSGHLTGADGRRVGIGLQPAIAQQIESYRELLADSFDDRAFNFLLEQGDILIWLGMKPFIDSRVGLYGGEESLVTLHQELRQSLRIDQDPETNAANRQRYIDAFDRYQIHQVLPRGPLPDFFTYYSLLSTPTWQLTRQEAEAASFYRTDSGNAELADYLEQHEATRFVARFLQADQERSDQDPAGIDALPRGDWPQPPTFYDRYLYLPQPATPNEILLAADYDNLRGFLLGNQQFAEGVALAYETIRQARQGLREDPDVAIGYLLLAKAYQFLDEVERGIQEERGMAHPLSGRFYQILSSGHLALDCDPHEVLTQYQLFEIYDSHRRYDLALKYLQLIEDATGRTSVLPFSDPKQAEERERNDARMIELQEAVDRVREQTHSALEAGTDRLATAQSAYANGCPQLALDVLEDDLTLAASNPLAGFWMGMLLLEVGRTPEALEQLERLRGTQAAEQIPQWPVMTAYANLAADDLSAARTTLETSNTKLTETIAAGLLESLPLRFSGPTPTPSGALGWGDGEATAALRQIQTVALLNTVIDAQLEQNHLLRALIAIEAGDTIDATTLLEQTLSRNPHTSARPMIEQYLQWIANREPSPPPVPEGPPQEPDLFADDIEKSKAVDESGTVPKEDSDSNSKQLVPPSDVESKSVPAEETPDEPTSPTPSLKSDPKASKNEDSAAPS